MVSTPLRWPAALAVVLVACSDTAPPDARLLAPDGPRVEADAAPGGPDATAGAPDAPPPGPDAGVPPFPTVTLGLDLVASGLSQPTVIAQPPGETRLFVAEKTGTVRVLGPSGAPLDPPFIDISALVSRGGEQGLLGLAFHPRYAENGRVFVYFTGKPAADSTEPSSNVHIWELHRAADPSRTDGTHVVILDIPHPDATNHNGGNLAFGPDGKLYLGTGDGGGGFGQFGTTRVLTTRLAKLLRIDVDAGAPYRSPPDNPFAALASPEARDVWLWGLRNPWRWSFDRETGDLWIGDVGQQNWEEIDRVPAGQKGTDLGWNVVEGANHCPDAPTDPGQVCSVPGALLPVSEYDHSHGNAIVGGYVYRGQAIPELRGLYFFSDNGSGFVRSFWASAPVPFAQTKSWPALAQSSIATFGEDTAGELLLCSIVQGKCWRVVRR